MKKIVVGVIVIFLLVSLSSWVHDYSFIVGGLVLGLATFVAFNITSSPDDDADENEENSKREAL